ncbi:MAG: preprotein translocase subunit SecY, partial [Candidatus Adiutrix sp.]|nr:preprotein translocase subunit SecY [Candidatus Adiutrix sp.]
MALGGLENIGRAPELRKRVIFVLIMLAVYRIGVHIPTPGVNAAALAEYFRNFQGTLLGLFDMFSGRALSQFSVFALGIMPYISASIIVELLTVVWPYLGRLKKEGGQDGRRKLTQYARYGTVLLSLFQGYLIAVGLERMMPLGSGSVVTAPGLHFRLMSMITLTAGTAFIMWLGEQITERGIGNGISLIIFAGIVEGLPSAVYSTISQISAGEMSLMAALVLLAAMILIVAAVVFCERAQRRITIQHAQRMVGRRLMKGGSTHLPLKLNPAGVIPPIFASSLMMFPATLTQFFDNPLFQSASEWLSPGSLLYNLLYVGLIIFFCYFYTGVTFNPVDVAENMKKQGAFIPGIRPGERTAEYIDKVLTRIVMWGAFYVSLICLLPTFVTQYFHVGFYFGGTALLIVVGVA